jgi:hypothetical protein
VKKTDFGGKKAAYSVAMSKETGCIVMIRIETDDSLKVMGSLDREQSLLMAKDIQEWSGTVSEAVGQAVKPKLSLVS